MLAPFTGSDSGVFAARAMQCVFGGLAAVLTAVLGGVFDRRVGIAAGLLVACDPFLVFFSSLILTETPFTAALIGLWIALWKTVRAPSARGWIVVGILAAVCVYLRESSLGLVVAGPILVAVSKPVVIRSLWGPVVVLGIVVLTLIPWAARNRAVTGHWCWLTHRGGITLYDGVGPQATGASDLGDIKQCEAVRGLDEVAWDRHFWRQAIESIRSDPGRIVRLAGLKLARMWNPIPNVETYRSSSVWLISAGWTIPMFVLAAVGVVVVTLRRESGGVLAALLLLLPAIYFSVLHSVFVGSVRYRIPALPMLSILAALALVGGYDGWMKRRRAVASNNLGA